MQILDQFVAFNAEVTALVRAGVAIDLGLAQLSSDPEVATQKVDETVRVRMQAGDSLADALSTEVIPRVYQGVVVAGLRCGHMSAALGTLSQYTRMLLRLRESLQSALFYPLVICGLAYALFVGSSLFISPEYYEQLTIAGSGTGVVARGVHLLRASLPIWVAFPPLLLAGLMVAGRKPNSGASWSGGLPVLLRYLPGASAVVADIRRASFADLLATLVEHEVALPEGLRLAGYASGDRRLTSAVDELAVESSGGAVEDSVATHRFPPLLRWALSTEDDGLSRTENLRLAARMYRHRAARGTRWLQAALPLATCVVLAGGITFLYSLSVFVPLIDLIKDLG